MTTKTTPAQITFQMEGIHHIDASTFLDGRYLCLRCKRMVDAERWARPCGGPVSFDHIFKPGVEGANHTGDRATESHESPSPSTPSQTNQGA